MTGVCQQVAAAPSDKRLDSSNSSSEDETWQAGVSQRLSVTERKEGGRRRTVDVALTLVRLRDEEVGYVAADAILVAHGIAAQDLL